MSTTHSDAPDSPFSDVRSAFRKLATAEKTAFIVEATVDTISDAIEETSERVGAWFDAMEPDTKADGRKAKGRHGKGRKGKGGRAKGRADDA